MHFSDTSKSIGWWATAGWRGSNGHVADRHPLLSQPMARRCRTTTPCNMMEQRRKEREGKSVGKQRERCWRAFGPGNDKQEDSSIRHSEQKDKVEVGFLSSRIGCSYDDVPLLLSNALNLLHRSAVV